MATESFALEILNSTTNQWVDSTADVESLVVPYIGLSGPRAAGPKVGQMSLTLNNQGQTYNNAAAIAMYRPIRVRKTTASMGYIVRVQYGGGSSSVIPADAVGISQQQNISSIIGDVWTLTWEARAQFDSQYNTDRMVLQTEVDVVTAIGHYTNKWQSYSLTLNCTHAGGTVIDVRPDGFGFPSGTSSNAKVLEYRNFVLRKNAGANVLVNGNFANGQFNGGWVTYVFTGTWTVTATVIPDYKIVFNGRITNIKRSAFVRAGDYQCKVTAQDLVGLMAGGDGQKVDLPLQKNKRADQLIALALTQLNPGSYANTIALDMPYINLPLTETSGSTASDLSGNGLNGTYTGTITLAQVGPLGNGDVAPSFGGGHVSLSAAPNINNISWLVEVSFLCTSLPTVGNRQTLFAVFGANASNQAISLEIHNVAGTTFLYAKWYGGGDTQSTQQIAVNTWYNAQFQYDFAAGTFTILCNGVQVYSAAHAAFSTASALTAYIGDDPGGSAPFTGEIGKVGVWLNTLATSLLSVHYNAWLGQYNTVVLPGALLDTGISTLDRAFDGYNKSRTTVGQANTDAAVSEAGGVWYVDLDGTVRFRNRTAIPVLVTQAPALTLGDGMPFTMTPTTDSSAIHNDIRITYHPRQTVVSTIVLGQVTSPIIIPPIQPGNVPGQVTFTINFVDSAGNPIGGDNFQALTATTDYLINDRSDGTGFDYTSNAAFKLGPVTLSASQATITLYNYATGNLYATKFQIRGNGVYTYNPITVAQRDTNSIVSGVGFDKPLTLDLAFNADGNLASSLAYYLLNRYKGEFIEVPYIEADWETQLNGVDLFGLELFQIVSISDVQTGLSNVLHLIIGFGYEFHAGQAGSRGVKKLTIYLERLDQQTYWILNSSLYSVLGTTSIPYF